jgi:hypothetical protein
MPFVAALPSRDGWARQLFHFPTQPGLRFIRIGGNAVDENSLLRPHFFSYHTKASMDDEMGAKGFIGGNATRSQCPEGGHAPPCFLQECL